MEQMALYRKYRPVTFSEVIGQEQVVKSLSGALALGEVAHAYLFSGPRGTGKTSVARILARELGTSANDLYEVDAASNRGIDEIRELREAVRTLPFDSKYKVYIIDEVHMLTREASNALLKTLEEPPAHVIFILATTEAHKLPETIISRCQTLNFKKPTDLVLAQTIKQIVEAEGHKGEAEAYELIALLGEASFRDAIGLLQQVISTSGSRKITREAVEAVTAAPRRELIESLIRAVLDGDLPVALKQVERARRDNYDFKVLLKLILRQLRLSLLLKFAPHLKVELESELSPDEIKFLVSLTESPGATLLPQVLRELLAVYDEVNRTDWPELPLELALIKLLEPAPSR